jgi:hypothetical protein
MTCIVPLAAGLAATAAQAQPQDIGRVGRIVELVGDVSFHDLDSDQWVEAWRNRPVTTGDRIVLARGARAELRVGGATLLLAQGADLEVLALDDDRLKLELHRGALAMRLPSRDIAEQTEVRTRETRLRPQRAGHYRIDREADDDGRTYAAVWRGSLEASGHNHLLLIDAGERHEIWLDDRRDDARSRPARMPDDRLAAWADESFRADECRAETWRPVSPELPDIPGIDELDRHGRWERHPEFGLVWFPIGVSVGWRPFHDGRWAWVRPWGWTWVDAQPWGFTPSHYGRWVDWHGRWVWWPGRARTRAVFSPAVVAWVGGPHVSVSVSIGQAPPPAWVPLAPYQTYVPIVVAPPRVYPPRRPPPPKAYPQPVPTGPISRPAPGSVSYGTQGVPVGVTAVSGARPVQAAPAVSAVPPAPVPQPVPVAGTPPTGPVAPVVVQVQRQEVRSPKAPPDEKPEKADKAEKAEKADRADRSDKADRADKAPKSTGKPDRPPEPRRRDQVQ